MKKCKNFESENKCECFNDWYKPALELTNEKEAEVFTSIFQSLKGILDNNFFNEYSENKVIEVIENTKEIIPISLIELFKQCFLVWFKFNYNWRFNAIEMLKIEKCINELEAPKQIKSNSKTILSQSLINQINSDFSNVDFVYNELKEIWINNNIEKSELEFIKYQQTLIFSKNDIWNKDVENLDYNRKLQLHEYLQKKQTSVEWTDYDNYKHYLQTKRFHFSLIAPFHKRLFESISIKIEKHKQLYYYIFNKLSENEKIEFKNDFCDHIQKLINVQTESKYKELLTDFLATINDHYTEYKNTYNVLQNDFDKLPLKQKIEVREAENKLRNQQILNQYYSNIKGVKYFEKHILNRESETYYKKVINEYTQYRNNQLLINENLNCRIELLRPFNNLIGSILETIVWSYSKVVEWKKNNTELHENNLDIRFSSDISYLKNDFIQSIKLNLDSNPLLALALKVYCVNGFDLMIDFLKTEILIDFKQSPLFPEFQELITIFKNTVNNKDVELLSKLTPILTANKPPQQSNSIVLISKTPIKVIALLNWYSGISITRENANQIVSKYDYTSKTSGEGLYQDYVYFSKNTNRLASGGTLRKLKLKIKLFENVIDLLVNQTAKSKAESELITLKNKLLQYD